MSRLFEALSNLQVKRNSPGVIFPTQDSPVPARPQIAVVEAASSEAATEEETQDFQPEFVPEPVAPTGAFRPKSVGGTIASRKPMQEVKAAAQMALPEPAEVEESPSIYVSAPPESRLIALSNPNSLGAEKFRALVTRLDHHRKTQPLTSFQVTSSVIHEGKTLVAGNVAVTLAKDSGYKTLLIEGDLHRPTLSPLFGLRDLPGLSHWWSGGTQDLAPFLYRLNGMPLWFLSAGRPCERPSEILRSERFAKAFAQLASQFDWIVVDSTPMLPIVDVNLWSKLVDGTLLVVREGVTPVKALKKGLQALDHPKLIGVVMNEASEAEQKNYDAQYYNVSKPVEDQLDDLS